MKRTWTIIGVSDVPLSYKWYQSLFGQPATSPGHPDFGQLLDSDGTVLLCLHQWGVEDHPALKSPRGGAPGNGLLLFFRVDDYRMALRRARALVEHFEEEPHLNPNTRTKEFSVRDPDGYYVTVSALSAIELHAAASERLNKRPEPTKARGHGNPCMSTSQQVDAFLAAYPEQVRATASAARRLLKGTLPGVAETVDESAKLLGYGYGPGYKGVVCTLIMSQTGVKLGVFRGSELPDPKHLMAGTGKIHRYIQLRNVADIKRPGLKPLLKTALGAWRTRSRAREG